MLQSVYRLADFHFVSKTESKLYKVKPHTVWDKTVNMLRKKCFNNSTELETHLTLSVLKRKIPKISLDDFSADYESLSFTLPPSSSNEPSARYPSSTYVASYQLWIKSTALQCFFTIAPSILHQTLLAFSAPIVSALLVWKQDSLLSLTLLLHW